MLLGIFIGMLIGSFMGFITAALCASASRQDDCLHCELRYAEMNNKE